MDQHDGKWGRFANRPYDPEGVEYLTFTQSEEVTGQWFLNESMTR
jgi:hypothetical protein